ncbi:MAG TPA: hypothetical protein VK171_11760 [Fimbriimonas sp.]|nr:hypothetical protein [Fimbriimonas sp.]
MADEVKVKSDVSLSAPVVVSWPADDNVRFTQIGPYTVRITHGKLWFLSGGKWHEVPDPVS